ncbi:hypothetical protein HGM15179_005674 [Zosterops borbonicus]|uniref:non-specific serine/threonine protein kinase n=2 Tax=Zosterops borbonicus TaxID=364589 RepID=A0A8K1LPW4_9PASS|nr:hypothetical protein HGM15179_005674 [Zosterops borbonicus]
MCPVAIKKINLQGVSNMQDIVSEIIVMKRNRSPHVVNYLDSYLVCKELWLVMEYMDGGTLYDAINETQMCKDETAIVSWECLQGLDYLHSNHVVHRDLKSLNILLRTDGSVKLGQYILGQAQFLIATKGIPELQQSELLSPLLRHFLSCCLQTDEARRWSAQELLQHPFVTSAKPTSSLAPLVILVNNWKEKTGMRQ